MRFRQQLQWRIISAHMVVVIVGVITVLVATAIILNYTVPTHMEPCLESLIGGGRAEAVDQALVVLIGAFRTTLLSALLIAASSALVAGLITSVPLTRGILRPLQEINQSSQRIAGGQYGERVAIPDTEELARVALNFNQMAEALEQIEQQRVALIGNVSHELRTPLSGIAGYLEGLMDGLLPKDDETFAQMYQEVRRLRRLVDDLQALSKVEAGQLSLNLLEFDLIPVIRRVVSQLRPQAIAQNIQVTLDMPAQAPVYADPDRTAQILINLIGNAIRYTPEEGAITVEVSSHQKVVKTAVHDTGIGIPPEVLPYLFERFYRVDQSRARHSGGSGIGLTISRHLAWAMGGELSAASAGPDQGSTFCFTLPRPR